MKKLLIFLLAAVMMFSLVACNSSSDSNETEELATDVEKVSIMLDWYPNAVHSFLYAAEEQGYFKEAGLDVTINMPAETSDPLNLVAAGKVDFALTYQPGVVMARANDIPVVSVASIVGHPLNILMTKEDAGINTPKDFEGKTVGYSLPVYEAIAKTMVKNNGGDLSKVNLINIGFDLMPGLSTGKVDVISGGFVNHERVLLEKEGEKIKTIDPVEFGVPDYHELILVASEDTAKDKKATIEKFYKAIEKGQNYVKENPEKALNSLLENQNEAFPLEKDVEVKSLETLLPLMKDFGKQTEESWQEVIDWMSEYELINKKIEAKDAFMSAI